MKIRLIKTVSMVLTVVVLFSGCSLLDFFSAENLLKAPGLTGENAALQQSFESVVGTDISLYTPIAGEYRSSYILVDINDDKTDEALVFYALNTNKSVVHMHILSKQSDVWHSVADIVGSGTSVYKVDFFNIDDENNLEVAVTWMVDDSKKAKTLSLYKVSGYDPIEENTLTSVATIQIADYIYLDIDSDSINELLYLYFDTSGEDSAAVGARLLDYDIDNKNLLPVSNLALDSQITSFVQVLYNKSGENYHIYLDCLNSDGKLFTEIILYDNTKAVLSVPQLDGNAISVFTVRDASLLCQDFDNDGQYNIPLQLEYEDSYSLGAPEGITEQIRFISWNVYNEGVLYENSKYYINSVDQYVMNIDDFYENCYMVYDYINKETQVRSKKYSENNIIFTIKCSESDMFDSLLLEEREDFIISITPMGASMHITKTYIMDLISDKGWFF